MKFALFATEFSYTSECDRSNFAFRGTMDTAQVKTIAFFLKQIPSQSNDG